jgi:hypothetical protein
VQGYLPEGVTINCTAPGPTPTEGKLWTGALQAVGEGWVRSFMFWYCGWREISTGIQGMLTLMGSPVMEGITGHLLDFGFSTYPSVCLRDL